PCIERLVRIRTLYEALRLTAAASPRFTAFVTARWRPPWPAEQQGARRRVPPQPFGIPADCLNGLERRRVRAPPWSCSNRGEVSTEDERSGVAARRGLAWYH